MNSTEIVQRTFAEHAGTLENGYWYCGRCNSIIPLSYWHDCDDNHVHSAPYKEDRW